MFIKLDNIIFADFDIDDFPLTEEGVHDCEVPLVLSGFDCVVLVELEFELFLWGFKEFGQFFEGDLCVVAEDGVEGDRLEFEESVQGQFVVLLQLDY